MNDSRRKIWENLKKVVIQYTLWKPCSYKQNAHIINSFVNKAKQFNIFSETTLLLVI